jgi:hypothetical protein
MHRLPPSECSPFTIFGAKISRVGRVEIYTSRSDHVTKPACCDGDIMQPGHHASGMSRIEIPAIVCARIYGTVDKRAAAPIYDSGVGCEPAFDQKLLTPLESGSAVFIATIAKSEFSAHTTLGSNRKCGRRGKTRDGR